jgi:putative SOS response-associated peptidase YedK
MCNDYEQHLRWADYCKMMQALELGIPSRQSELDLPQADDVRINDTGPAMRAAGDEIELVPMTFSFPPGRPGGAPVFNFRSEGRHFDKSGRCLIPASAFFEFTGKKYPKAKHRFALKGSPITAIAGIWREGHGNHPPSFTMLTTAPGPDVIPYHNRQVVVLRPEDWLAWLALSKTEAELLRPPPGARSMWQRYARGVAEFASVEPARH